jgi:hypothetical protein
MIDPITGAAIIGGGFSLLGGLLGKSSAKKAAKAELKAQREQMAFVREGQERANGILMPGANYQPALSKLMALNGLSGGQAQQDAYAAFQETPGYQFRRDQGIGAANRSAASRGTSLSGRTLMDLGRFGDGMAAQEYDNYYSRLGSLYGSQLGTAGQVSSNYTGAANNLSGIAGQMGQTRANGFNNQGNQMINALQGVAGSAAYGLEKYQASKNPTMSSYGGMYS